MNIEEKVKNIIFELSGEENIENSMTLQNDLSLDSLLMITLLIEIEEKFEITLNESDMNPFELTTVQSVIDLVRKYIDEEL